MANVLVTGGAGFIGSHLVDELVKRGHRVRVFDSLVHQVHHGRIPKHLNQEAEFYLGDVRDKEALSKALEGVDVVYHQAAEVGLGQSMYEISRYVSANILGTANVLDLIVNNPLLRRNVQKIIVAASISQYGEGAYTCKNCGIHHPKIRSDDQLNKKQWEYLCPNCEEPLIPIPTTEEKPQHVTSIYGITKKAQEQMVLNVGQAYAIPVVALRYFNVYGPRQSLQNPYTGVAAIFASRIKHNQLPLIFEDGNQKRDFVSVHDIVQANMLAMEKDKADYHAFNIGSGETVTIKHIADTLLQLSGKNIAPVITEQYRKGDIRHCFANIEKAQRLLGYAPKHNFRNGMQDILSFAETAPSQDLFNTAKEQLHTRGLIS